jgi:hypothetical protein
MVTQSLRGLAGTAPYHWRGDRFGISYAPGGDVESFKDFNPAFIDLMGRAVEIPDAAMESFARFILTIRLSTEPQPASESKHGSRATSRLRVFHRRISV